MRVSVDLDLCEGHGLCYFESAELFDLRASDGKAVVLQEEVPEDLEEAAGRCVDVCPERAIKVTA